MRNQPDPPLARLLAEKLSHRQIVRLRWALRIVFWSLAALFVLTFVLWR